MISSPSLRAMIPLPGVYSNIAGPVIGRGLVAISTEKLLAIELIQM